MDITIYPRKLAGSIRAIPSKSIAHRLLICAAFADAPTTVLCPDTNRDIEATVDCLNALGAGITRTEDGYSVMPAAQIPNAAVLNCHESGSTLRFMLPVAGALGVDTTFLMEGRLPQRPLSPLWEEMERMGCRLSRPTENTVRCEGKLRPGSYRIPGDISSQFITGLLLAYTLMGGESTVAVIGKLESRPYVEMTQKAMALFGIDAADFHITAGTFKSPGTVAVEGDWSNAAFFLGANALGCDITVSNLDTNSAQGDKACADLIPNLLDTCTISAADIPDLIPILSVVAAAGKGAVFTDIRRLRLKESDRIASVIAMLEALGGSANATEDTLTVLPCRFHGGTVDACGDHRIAMSSAIAATAADGPVTILGAQCVSKSYPAFWEEYNRLGGYYEFNIR